jgi:hypothetical protein
VIYFLTVQQFVRSLKNLDHVLGKAEEHAKARKYEVNNFCTQRIAPDMLPFMSQIRIACDTAKNSAALFAGKEPPKHEDTETTFAELRGRIAKCVAYLETFTIGDFEKTRPDTVIKLPNRPGQGMLANDYLFIRQIPNFYFHVVTAYDVLRAGGVEIGKTDYLGPLPQIAL